MTPAPHISGDRPRGSLAGRLLLSYYHKPLGKLKTLCEVGIVPYFTERHGENRMRHAAANLPIETRRPKSDPSAALVFLTGSKYWHETLFCIRSLLRVLPDPPPIRIISDGSLSDRLIAIYKRQLPHSEIITTAEVEASIDTNLPRDRFPMIRFYRDHKPIIRKLTDVFSITKEPQLLLDSDMLFYSPPHELMAWLKEPREFIAMRDIKDAYGYSLDLMQSLTGAPIPSEVNIGVFGLSGREIDWDEIEHWIRVLTETEGLKYNLCQALSAMLYAKHAHTILDPDTYLLLPGRSETLQPTAIMHHYVAESKQWYRRYAWRHYHNFGDDVA